MLRLFSAGVKAPPKGARIVYIDGAWDMFHAGHVAILKEVRASALKHLLSMLRLNRLLRTILRYLLGKRVVSSRLAHVSRRQHADVQGGSLNCTASSVVRSARRGHLASALLDIVP